MTVIETAVKNGKIELVAPKEWPEGTEVVIEPVSTVESFGRRDEDGPTTPEGSAQHLALFDGNIIPTKVKDDNFGGG